MGSGFHQKKFFVIYLGAGGLGRGGVAGGSGGDSMLYLYYFCFGHKEGETTVKNSPNKAKKLQRKQQQQQKQLPEILNDIWPTKFGLILNHLLAAIPKQKLSGEFFGVFFFAAAASSSTSREEPLQGHLNLCAAVC